MTDPPVPSLTAGRSDLWTFWPPDRLTIQEGRASGAVTEHVLPPRVVDALPPVGPFGLLRLEVTWSWDTPRIVTETGREVSPRARAELLRWYARRLHAAALRAGAGA